MDAGFETPDIASYQYQPSGSPWVFLSGSGIAHNGGGFGGPSAPEGNQVGFAQSLGGNNGAFYQDVSGFQAATYQFTVAASLRSAPPFSNIDDFQVLLDGQSLGTFTVSFGYQDFTTTPVTTTAGTHRLEFLSLDSTKGNDASVLLDNVRVRTPNPVPEASTTISFGLLLALGMGGVVIAAKRKKTA